MSIFKRDNSRLWVIKLFKTTDEKSAEEFKTVDCINEIINLLIDKTNLSPTNFDVNYKDSRKTLNSFRKALRNSKDVVYSFVGFNSDKNNTFFLINNPMLNRIEKPINSSIDVCIQISDNYIDQTNAEIVSEKLLCAYRFDYGYITNLPSNFDALSERKIKRGLFSTSTEVTETDLVWDKHIIGINHSFIKQLYKINYFNKSQVDFLNKHSLISEFGNEQVISKEITKWTLNDEEFEIALRHQKIKEMSIMAPGLDFLKTDKAKEFERLMEI